MLKFLFLFFIVFIYKFLTNLYFLFKVNNYYKKYVSYVENFDKTNPITKCSSEIKDLFKRANLADDYFNIRYDYTTARVSIFSNMFTNNQNVIAYMIYSFGESKIVFTRKIKQCFSLIYWVESVIFLPINLIRFIGIDSEKSIYKIASVFWWIILFLISFFQLEIKNFVTAYLSNFFK